jgi:hypothetical protein
VLTPDRFDQATVRRFFTSHYDASINYREFANRLLALRQAVAG